MTDRIIDPQTGEYVSPPTPDMKAAQGADPDSLPTFQPDPYAEIDVTNFDGAGGMSKHQLLTMANIAHSRGMTDEAMKWKLEAVSSDTTAARQADAERMERLLHPTHAPMSSGPIVPQRSDLPWETDETYVEIRDDLETAKAKLEGFSPGTSDHTEAGIKVANLTTALSDREDEVRQSALDTGIVTEMDLRSLAAQQQLADKAAAVIGMFAQGGE